MTQNNGCSIISSVKETPFHCNHHMMFLVPHSEFCWLSRKSIISPMSHYDIRWELYEQKKWMETGRKREHEEVKRWERWEEILANYSEINAERSISVEYLRTMCVCVVPGCTIHHNYTEVTTVFIFYPCTAANDLQSHNMTNWPKLLQSKDLNQMQDINHVQIDISTE